jgi:hypothetical protein
MAAHGMWDLESCASSSAQHQDSHQRHTQLQHPKMTKSFLIRNIIESNSNKLAHTNVTGVLDGDAAAVVCSNDNNFFFTSNFF